MHIFLDNFRQGVKYPAYTASHQAELRGEIKFIDQKYLSVSSLQTDYLNIYNGSGSGRNNERKILLRKNALFWRY